MKNPDVFYAGGDDVGRGRGWDCVGVNIGSCLLEILLDKIREGWTANVFPEAIQALGVFRGWGQATIRARLMINLEKSAHQVSGRGRLHYGLRLHLPLQIGHHHRWMEPGAEDEAAKLGSSGDPER